MTSKSEQQQQVSLVKSLRLLTKYYPELALLHHIPNGGLRDPKTAVQLKQMGVLKGVPDLFLPLACFKWHGLYIELKTKEGKLSVEQIAVQKLLRRRRYYVINGAENAVIIRRIRKYVEHSRTSLAYSIAGGLC